MIHVHDRKTQTHHGRFRTAERRTISDVIRDLRDETLLLVKQEIALARTEMAEKLAKVARNVLYIAVGGAIAYAGLLVLLGAATAGVFVALIEGGATLGVALWLAPLIVGIIVAIVGYIFFQKGLSTLKNESLAPKRTMRSLKEDKRWLEQSMK